MDDNSILPAPLDGRARLSTVTRLAEIPEEARRSPSRK
jgi:hypothetical protein